MMTSDCEIYVINQGYKHISEVSPGDKVYSLNNLFVEETEVLSVRSEWINEKIHVINSGQHNVDVVKGTKHLYFSENHGPKYLTTPEIYSHTRSKSADPNKYTPVLSWPYIQDKMSCTLVELEYVARMVTYRHYDVQSFMSIVNRCTGEDALVLIDMLEFWHSDSPGKGQFKRVSVGARQLVIRDKLFLEELARMAVLAGFTASTHKISDYRWALKVYFEPMPIPSSIPKDQKFLEKLYAGVVYSIEVNNRQPVFGKSKDRYVYLPVY